MLDELHSSPVRDNEIERARALIETEFLKSMQTAGDRAEKLSMFATYFGDPALVNDQVQRYRKVRAADVADFVRARLGDDNRAALLYVPRQPGGVEADAAATAEVAS
jgi:predicted Zn-dependent peptidase